jgi:deoxyribonuclease-1-like protein
MRWWLPIVLLLFGFALIALIGFVFLGWFVVSGIQGSITTTTQPIVSTTIPSPSGNTISIASWNLQAFGEKKASDDALMKSYVDKMDRYDIVIIQEIRDSSGTAFKKLCNLMAGYKCMNSSRAGSTTSKEQYGIIYKNAELLGITDFNSLENNQKQFNRPPFMTTFQVGNWTFHLTTIHTDPDNVANEVQALETIFFLSKNSISDDIIIGDMNADCSYYHTPPANFKDWNWAIPDSEDTTVATTDCAYDRIITNEGATKHFLNYSINRDISKEQSDHYLVSAIFLSA